PQPRPPQLLPFPAQLPQQSLHLPATRPLLPLIPRRTQPPIHLAQRLQPELQQPQQTQRQHLDPRRPLHRLLRPGAAFLPAQPLLQIPKAILLPKAPREHLHHLQPRQVQRRGDQVEAVAVAFHLRRHGLDRHGVSGHRPQTDDLLPAHDPLPAVNEGPALVPGYTPAASLLRWRQTWPPLGLGTPTPRRPLGRRSFV